MCQSKVISSFDWRKRSIYMFLITSYFQPIKASRWFDYAAVRPAAASAASAASAGAAGVAGWTPWLLYFGAGHYCRRVGGNKDEVDVVG